MANLMDLSECLAKEGRLAQKYEGYRNEATNDDFKNSLNELKRLSIQKMKILHEIISEGPWLQDE
ncbi:hypothetical protein KC717_05540 [Candidatus Dojkabacteria bacterium]|uniref:Uncharacterized protein n=1 Tax=Candidatus Dojkabacteria bacterium TaxID=2099670 RepID=A0A955RL93_9BACT|nr:hypothetical protein [Candidatus Dojkabacteria bacterium]